MNKKAVLSLGINFLLLFALEFLTRVQNCPLATYFQIGVHQDFRPFCMDMERTEQRSVKIGKTPLQHVAEVSV